MTPIATLLLVCCDYIERRAWFQGEEWFQKTVIQTGVLFQITSSDPCPFVCVVRLVFFLLLQRLELSPSYEAVSLFAC